MTEHGVPLCLACKHFGGFKKKRLEGVAYDVEVAVCAAFPDGIPIEILQGGDHREPWPGDHDIRFELKDGAELPMAFQDTGEKE